MFVIELTYRANLAEIDTNGRARSRADFRVIQFRVSQRADDIPKRIGA